MGHVHVVTIIEQLRARMERDHDEAALCGVLERGLNALRTLERIEPASFHAEQRAFLERLATIERAVREFVRLVEEVADATEAIDDAALASPLVALRPRLAGLAVQRRVDVELRRLEERWPTLRAATERRLGREIEPGAPACACGAVMTLRRGRYGPFWGCRAYPTCRRTRRAMAG